MTASILTLKKNKNKRGQMTIFIFVGIMIVFAIIMYLLVIGIMAAKINSALDKNVTIGQVNLKTINADTYGQYNTMILNNADFMGISSIFGMVLGLFLSAYFLRGRLPKWGIILDLFIIIVIFIFSVYLSQTYSTLIDALASAGETFLEDSLNKTSMFIVNLPIFVAVIGAIMMILFHSAIPRKREDVTGGFQGI